MDAEVVVTRRRLTRGLLVFLGDVVVCVGVLVLVLALTLVSSSMPSSSISKSYTLMSLASAADATVDDGECVTLEH